MKTYLGYEVLELKPNSETELTRKSTTKVSVVASTIGARRVIDKRGVPVTTTTLTLTALNPAAAGELRAFITARRGRVVPFWIESQKADLVVASAAEAGDSTLIIRDTGYTINQFKGKRRHIIANDQIIRITGAVVNGDGTETLQLASKLQEPLHPGTCISFMLLCRLGSDEATLRYPAPSIAEVSIDAVELPHETP